MMECSPPRFGALQRQVENLAVPFKRIGAFIKQKEIVDCVAHRDPIIDNKDPRHRFACGKPSVGESRHGCLVMCQNDPAIVSRPGKHYGVLCPNNLRFLDPDEIDPGVSQLQTSGDIVVEVLVGQKTEHSDHCGRLARSRSRISDKSPCVASTVRFISLACLSRSARYSLTSVGWLRKYQIAA